MTDAIDRVQVHVWSLDVSDSIASALISLLSDDERARARRLVKPQDGSRFVAARAGMRMLLARVTGSAPRDLSFTLSPFGKPELAEAGGVHFNLSHSDGMAVLAITRRAPVGIDLEQNKALAPGIEEQFLVSAEIRLLRAMPAAERDIRLVESWATKEALIKLQGDRHQLRPKDIELDLSSPIRVRLPASSTACSFTRLEVATGFTCILAMYSDIKRQDIEVDPWTGLLSGLS